MRKRENPPKEEKTEGEEETRNTEDWEFCLIVRIARENQLVQIGAPAIHFHTENNPDTVQ